MSETDCGSQLNFFATVLMSISEKTLLRSLMLFNFEGVLLVLFRTPQGNIIIFHVKVRRNGFLIVAGVRPDSIKIAL